MLRPSAKTDMTKSGYLILGDQLNFEKGVLKNADPADSVVVMIESKKLATSLSHHKQKLVHAFSSMRHFRDSLVKKGFDVRYYELEESFETGLRKFTSDSGVRTVTCAEPNDRPFVNGLGQIAKKLELELSFVPNQLWITSISDYDDWADGRKSILMEYFYREMRKKLNILMTPDGPEGGQWNYDKDNRKKPKKGHEFPEVSFPDPDEITRTVIADVENAFPDNFGTTTEFGWAVTRESALSVLQQFCDTRLKDFGAYEDAMLTDQRYLYHSTLSPLINVGLLHPREVIDAAIETFRDPEAGIPINSIEGFVRQVMGWREFMFHIYRTKMSDLHGANVLEQTEPLPPLYWTGDTKMSCMSSAIEQVKATAYNHHIQRLMVLGNFAMIYGVVPSQILDWFTACYIDALDWVMIPNVIGMSQFADGGTFTSKPYAASSNYINKMSDHCKGCHYDRKATTETNACPFNALYWDFLIRHEARLTKNHRMGLMMGNVRKKSENERIQISDRSAEIRELAADGVL